MSRPGGRVAAVLAVVTLVLAGCSTGADRTHRRADAAAEAAPCLVTGGSAGSPTPAAAGSAGSPTPAAGSPTPAAASPTPAAGGSGPAAGEPLPDLTLPCFVGGHGIRLARLGTPMVINLWASWCAPCRTELPQIERYAERAGGRVQVVGVITADPNRSGARSLVDDLGLRFPMLYDEPATLRTRIGVQALPATLLVDAHGRLVYRYNATPLDEPALADLVQRYLGVAG